MPASTLEGSLSAAIRSSLAKNCGGGGGVNTALTTPSSGLDQQLAGVTKMALLEDIDFEPYGTYQDTVLNELKDKYIVLSASVTENHSPNTTRTSGSNNSSSSASQAISSCSSSTANGSDMKLSTRQLFPLESVQLGWPKCREWSVGSGMVNMGNTCYLNSILQALFHVPSLVNWLISDKEHMVHCQDNGGCIICAMSKTLMDSQQRSANSIRPILIYNKLRVVWRNLIPGRQEDAHEFLRYLVEAMEKCYLTRFKNHIDFDSKLKETTPLNQILGGYLRSAVRCLKCGHVSTTFQHFQDLLLDIRKAQTLEDALDGYFACEKLDEDSYNCQACKEKVPATKQFCIERAPMVLCIQLKRFSVSNNKITKHLSFRQRLDLGKFMRRKASSSSTSLGYKLVALVTHMGPTVNCGHYTAVAQGPSGSFYLFDDSMVRVINYQAVFQTNAYIMLYELDSQSNKQNANSLGQSLSSSVNVNSSATTPAKIKCNENYSPSLKLNGTMMRLNSTSLKVVSAACSSNTNGANQNVSRVSYGPDLPPSKRLNGDSKPIILNGMRSFSSLVGLQRKSSSSTGSISTHATPNSTTCSSTTTTNSTSCSSSSSESDDETQQRNAPTQQQYTQTNAVKKIIFHSPVKVLTDCTNGMISNKSTSSPSSQSALPPPPPPPPPPSVSTSYHASPKHNNNCTKLVPYETDDSSCSEESSLATEVNNRHINEKADNKDSYTHSKIPSTMLNGKFSGEWKVKTLAQKWVNNNSSNGCYGDNRNSTTNGNGDCGKKDTQSYYNGYNNNAQLSTWSGTRSALEPNVLNERKRHLENSPDRRNHKHAKHHRHMNNHWNKSNPGYNPIQEFHNSKNWNGYAKPSYFNNNRHRRKLHFNQHFRNKNHRYRQ